MGEPSFTPGPWYVTEAAEDLGYCRIREQASDYVLATADDGGHVDPKFALPPETIEANAHLIAAAPELYEAVGRLLEEFVDPQQGIEQFDSAITRKAVELARVARAKAAGESVSDLGPISRGHVCNHGVRWPHPCPPCDHAALAKARGEA